MDEKIKELENKINELKNENDFFKKKLKN